MSPLGSKSAKKAEAKPDKKKAKPAKAAAAASSAAPAAATRGVVVQKPKSNIYTVLLILSFVAILIGCLALYMEMSNYGFAFKAPA